MTMENILLLVSFNILKISKTSCRVLTGPKMHHFAEKASLGDVFWQSDVFL